MTICLTTAMAQQSNHSPYIFLPKGVSYNIVEANKTSDVLVCINKNGDVYHTENNAIVGVDKTVELPNRSHPNALCWTNSGTLIMYGNDTIYSLGEDYILNPLLRLKAHNVSIQPYGENDFCFCVHGDTVVYEYNYENGKLGKCFTFGNPITDIIIDNEDIFFASGQYINVFIKEGYYVPILQNTSPIFSFALCWESSIIISDKDGCWFINSDRKKTLITNQPADEILTHNDICVLKMPNGSWLLVYPIVNYSKR